MKRSLILSSFFALLFCACKKPNDNNDSAASSWTFGGITYKAETVVYDNTSSSLSASVFGSRSGPKGGLSFVFVTPPASNSQMLITNSSLPNTVGVGVSTLSGTTTTYYISGETNVNANITITNGKISVSFPGTIWMHNLANSADSLQLSIGTIRQQ